MKPLQATLVFTCLVFFSLFLSAQTKYSTVKIYAPADKAQRAELLGLLQIDHFYTEQGAIVSEIGEEDVKKLKNTGYRYEILVDDVAKDLQKKNEKYFKSLKGGKANSRVAIEQVGGLIDNMIPTPSAFKVWTGTNNMGGYYQFSQMVTAMDNLVATYPSIAQKFTLGTSVEGRDIWCIKISDNVATDENEPEVLFMGLQHAREAIGGSSMIFLMQYLCENYATDSRIKDLVDNREIFIIPCMNPDGWEYNRTQKPNGGGGWRKNRKLIATGQYGVDLNRNWGIDWANCSAPIVGPPSSCGSSSKTSSNETYWGASAFSEPETQAVRAFAISHHLVAMIDQHAYGPYYSLPFGRPSLHPQPDSLTVAQQQFYTAIPALMGTYNGMRAGNSAQSVGYEVAGGVKDWMLKGEIGTGTKGIVYGMTGEGAAGGGNGDPTYGNFWAPANQIIYLCKGMTYQNLQLAYSAGSYVNIDDLDDIAVSSKTGSFNFQVRRIGLADQPVTVSLIPIENIQSAGSSVTIASLPNYYDTYAGNISYTLPAAITNGQRMKFAWKVQTGGYTYSDTVVKFYNPTQLFYDDMEGSTYSTNWTATSNVADKWAYTTLSAYQGTHSMTESPGGNYTTSTTRTATNTFTFDLSNATAAYLTFWVKHRAENYRDRLQVQLSINGGSTWPYIIAGSTTIQEPVTFDDETINGQPSLTGIRDNWTKEVYDLSSSTFRTNNVKIRFQFLSDANGSGFDFENDDGFYLDNVKLVKSTVPLIILPVKFVDVSGKLTTDSKIAVSWKATVDEKFSYFDVEKSTDGRTFKSIGTVAGSSEYSLIDANPVTGYNYYRIKGVDADGQFTYSKIIDVLYSSSNTTLAVYPNPVENILHVKISTREPESLTLVVTDIDGRSIYKQAIPAGSVNRNITVNAGTWKPQVYVIKAIGQNNEVLTVNKFIKK